MKWLPIFVILTVVMTTPSRSPTQDFKELIQPLLKEFCITCHSAEKQKGELDLERFSTVAQIKQQPQIWEAVLHQISDREMPPEDSQQPGNKEKANFLDDLSRTMVTARKVLSDSGGKITMRRLNKRDYQNSISLTFADPDRSATGKKSSGRLCLVARAVNQNRAGWA